MKYRISVSGLFVLLGILSIPTLYTKLAGLENGRQGWEGPLRGVQSMGSFALAVLIWIRKDWFREGTPPWDTVIVLLSIAWLEFATRLFFKYAASRFKPHSAIRNLEHSIWEQSSTLGEYFWIEAHPFLQFTGTRGITPSGDHKLGFGEIKLSDISKPEGVIRVACLGNSTSLDGYPEYLENYLNSYGGGRRFQVLNFAIAWWTSIHTMLNFVLNVRDFCPDILVVHENCNDEKYRGYQGLQGDCAHAMEALTVRRHRDEWLYRFLLLYRLSILFAGLISRRQYYRPVVSIGMRSGKTANYVVEELRLFRRNIETICTLAAAEKIEVVLTTMPFSTVLRYTDVDEVRFHPHLRDANSILRTLAVDRKLELVDLERLFAGRNNFFQDPFHLNREGAELKALETGRTILRSLGISPKRRIEGEE